MQIVPLCRSTRLVREHVSPNVKLLAVPLWFGSTQRVLYPELPSCLHDTGSHGNSKHSEFRISHIYSLRHPGRFSENPPTWAHVTTPAFGRVKNDGKSLGPSTATRGHVHTGFRMKRGCESGERRLQGHHGLRNERRFCLRRYSLFGCSPS